MKKIFVVVCRTENTPYLNMEKDTLFFSPLHEHVYRKFADACSYLNIDCELVRCSTHVLEGATTEINCDIEDIIVFAHPLAFLAERKYIEEALDYVNSSELGYATIGAIRSLYATIGTGKMLSEETVNSPYDFIHMIQSCGASCETKSFGGEKALPDNKLDYVRRCARYREEFFDYLILNDVIIEQRDSIVISPTATIGKGTVILPNTQICGISSVGEGCMIGPNSIVSGSIVCDNCVVDSSQIYASTIEKTVEVGPYCLIHDSCHLLSNSKIWAYTEIKKSSVGAHSTVHEHCLICDTDIGTGVTVGSNVITVNYDGKKISECKIADNAFIGSGVNLISPLNIGANAYVAAGSTITDDVPLGALAIAREYQSNHEGWSRRRAKKN